MVGEPMGKLIKLVAAKKEKIILQLLSSKTYLPSDRDFLVNLPLKDLEDMLKRELKK
ncbi:hypothetical protein [Peribacillus sp. SCS-155]|uniref:hypothetical protein n=1 Tax=Peribacillus sedimenti TaxID=3115297 RepID=UPI003906AA09